LALLRKQDIAANLTLAFGRNLDIIPSRGQALRYVAQRWSRYWSPVAPGRTET